MTGNTSTALDGLYVVTDITWTTEDKYIVTWHAWVGQTVILKGSGFYPGAVITITICDENRIWEDYIIVNECGAFEVLTTVPAWVTTGQAVSVRAWKVDDDGRNEPGYVNEGVLQATWPLDIGIDQPPD